MFKPVFDCSLSDLAPSAEDAETEDDDDAISDKDEIPLLMSQNKHLRKH